MSEASFHEAWNNVVDEHNQAQIPPDHLVLTLLCPQHLTVLTQVDDEKLPELPDYQWVRKLRCVTEQCEFEVILGVEAKKPDRPMPDLIIPPQSGGPT